MKLRSKILLITLPLSVASIVILEAASFYFIEGEIKNKLGKEADSIVSVLQSEVELMLGGAASTLEQYGDFPIFEQYSKYQKYGLTEEASITKKEMTATLERLLNRNEYYWAISYDDHKGSTVAYVYKPPFKVFDEKNTGFQLSGHENTEVSDAYYNKDIEQQIVRLHHHLKTSDNNYGYLNIYISLGLLFQNLPQQLISPGSVLYVFNRNNEVLYSTGNRFDKYNDNDKDVVRIGPKLVSTTGWYVGIAADKKELFALIDKLKWVALCIVILAVIGKTTFLTFLSSWISKPIDGILFIIKNISEGKFEQEVDLKKYRIVEFEQIAASLQEMGFRIKKSELKQKEEASLTALGQSTAMVAHDVRKPLTGMKALLSSLSAIKDDPHQLKKMIANVDRSISQTNILLNDILEFSRDSTSLNLSETDPQGIIVSALSDTLRNHRKSGVKINYDLRHSHVLFVDSNRIIRVLTNIMDNALDAIELNQGGKSTGLLQISTNEVEREGKRFIAISVADDGPGLSEDALAKVFDPFFTQGKAGGTGLGLSICQRIISMHGGSVEAANRTDGCGASFSIELPAGEKGVEINEAELIHNSNELKPFREEEAARIDYGDTANTSEFMRINKEKGRLSYLLIVDDEPLFRESTHCLLGELNQVKDHVKVVEADSAEKALTLFQSQEFDYVIADIDLGKRKMNGYEFAEIVLNRHPNTHILIHSNKRKNEMDKNIRRISNDKFMGFLPKPMRASELLQFLACKTFEVKESVPSETEKKTRVLLVNDDEAVRIGLKWQIKAMSDVQVVEAVGVSDALSKIADDNIGIILSDINLGHGQPSGYDLLKKIREQKSRNVRFYVVSGYSRGSEEAKALSMGADGYCQLPLEEIHLKRIFNNGKEMKL